mmetsp:Transcript_35061/g.112228  ORF Transcript_35061/g.112228 Transcript_35061/m.112228 type:complete len:254 (-) Transcript_35061:31-792(-)
MPPQVCVERYAVVTGANKGVGLEIARQLVPRVTLLILACRDRTRGEAAAKELGAVFEELDTSSATSIDAFADRLATQYGRLDVLVNNAGIYPSTNQRKATFATNFHGPYRLTERLLPLLASSDDGSVVNVASQLGALSQVSTPTQQALTSDKLTRDDLLATVASFETGKDKDTGSDYGLSKLFLIAYTKLLARDSEGTNLKVNACCPGYCNTDMTKGRGPRDPAVGARNAVILAGPHCPHHGAFIQNERPSTW